MKENKARFKKEDDILNNTSEYIYDVKRSTSPIWLNRDYENVQKAIQEEYQEKRGQAIAKLNRLVNDGLDMVNCQAIDYFTER